MGSKVKKVFLGLQDLLVYEVVKVSTIDVMLLQRCYKRLLLQVNAVLLNFLFIEEF